MLGSARALVVNEAKVADKCLSFDHLAIGHGQDQRRVACKELFALSVHHTSIFTCLAGSDKPLLQS